MNPFGKTVKAFFTSRGFKSGKNFTKFFPDRSLLAEVSFREIRNAYGPGQGVGYAMSVDVYYPRDQGFFLVSPGELGDLRKDGTLRRVSYINESQGIYRKHESHLLEAALHDHFDFWVEKIANPEEALKILSAFRGRSPFPSYLSYLNNLVAKDEQEKMQFSLRQESCIWQFDGGINFLAYVANLNSASHFTAAKKMIEQALNGTLFEGVRHSRVVVDNLLVKLEIDARGEKVRLGDANLEMLRDLGHSIIS